MSTEKYNGWTNRQTWNVALWIGNDEGLYTLAKEVAERTPENESPYEKFVEEMQEIGGGPIAFKTPDGVAWNDSGLDIEELDNMMREL